MVTVQISLQYTVKIPETFRSQLRVGQRVAINVDTQGRLMLTPVEQALASGEPLYISVVTPVNKIVF